MKLIRYLVPVAILLLLTGCGGDEPVANEAGNAYSSRGVVRALPSADRPGSELMIHHEAIPDFVDIEGKVVGMKAMTMPFPVAEASLLDGLSVGDRIAFRFEVDWDGSPPLRLLEVAPLAEGTVLGFETTEAGEGGADTPEQTTDNDENGGHEGHQGHQGEGESEGDPEPSASSTYSSGGP